MWSSRPLPDLSTSVLIPTLGVHSSPGILVSDLLREDGPWACKVSNCLNPATQPYGACLTHK